MAKVRFIQDAWGHEVGDVVEVSPMFRKALLEQLIAVDAATPVVERAVEPSPVAMRTATRKV